MQNLHNIEKSAFRAGEYVGYCKGVWIIRPSTSSYGRWVARSRDDRNAPTLFAWRLADMSAKLDALEVQS